MGNAETILAGRYRLGEQLGEGAMAFVHRAIDIELNREVAVKILRPWATGSDVARSRFEREARAMAGLDHPNILTVHDAGRQDESLFIVMELVSGRDFREIMQGGDRKAALRLLLQAARGVGLVHRKGLVHRDLKPGNILITADGEAKVADFGLAHEAVEHTALTRTGSMLGTPLYMAPEQVDGERDRITSRTDVYSLGAILYEILTGHPPHVGSHAGELFARIRSQEPPPPRRQDPGVHPDLEAVCLMAIEKNPANRYPDAESFADDLARHLDGRPVTAKPLSAGRRLFRRVRRRVPLIGAGIAVVIVLAVAAVLVLPAWRRAAAHDRARVFLDSGREILKRIDRLLTLDEERNSEIETLAGEARAEFEMALNESPDHPEAWLGIGRSHDLEGNHESAVEFLSRSIASDPEFPAPFFERARVRLVHHAEHAGHAHARALLAAEKKEIESDLRRARELSEMESDHLLAEGLLQFSEENYKSAVDRLREYSEQSVSDPVGWLWLGVALLRLERYEEAVAALTRALGYRPRSVTALRARGMANGQWGRVDEALADLRKATSVDPTSATTLANMSEALRLKGQSQAEKGRMKEARELWNEALLCTSKALALDSKEATILAMQAATRVMLGQLDEARKELEDVILRDPGNIHGHYTLATVLRFQGDPDEAIFSLTRVLELDPEYLDALNHRANLYSLRGDFVRAHTDLKKAIQVKPDYAPTHNNLASLYKRQGDVLRKAGRMEEALPLYRKAGDSYSDAIHHQPRYPKALLGRAGIRNFLKDRNGMFADLKRAVEIDPKFADGWFVLGNAWVLEKNDSEALRCYETALKVAPADWRLRKRLEQAVNNFKRK